MHEFLLSVLYKIFKDVKIHQKHDVDETVFRPYALCNADLKSHIDVEMLFPGGKGGDQNRPLELSNKEKRSFLSYHVWGV